MDTIAQGVLVAVCLALFLFTIGWFACMIWAILVDFWELIRR